MIKRILVLSRKIKIMKNVKLYLATLVFSLVFLNGCTEDNISITQEEAVKSLEIQIKSDMSESAKGQKSFVTGQGGIIFEGKHQNFAFHASMDSEGNVTGQWESKTVGANVRTHGTIYCLTFLDEKTAVMSGTITKVNKEDGTYPGAQVGNSIWFKVVDNGSGNTDQFSDYYLRRGDCIDYGFPLREISNGNIQVKRGYSNLIDIEGNEYNVVQIGSQIWMTENLRTTTYNDGTPIPNITDNIAWANATTDGYSWYSNDIANKDPYGAIYNGYALESGKLAPEGWHVPTNEEWEQLADYLGGQDGAGGKLKDRGFDHWAEPNFGATNQVGFNALGTGHRWWDGGFYGYRLTGHWWTSSPQEGFPGKYQVRYVRSNDDFFYWTHYPRTNGYGIRLVKD
jgi:uncharacterized protein (TIGR02145 family)